MTKREKLLDYLQETDHYTLLTIHNEYCNETNNPDDEIFDIDQLNEICSGQDAYWVACSVCFGDFNPYDDYIKFNGYGNFQSINKHGLSNYIDEVEIAEYILKNDIDFDNSDIRDILDDLEEENENE